MAPPNKKTAQGIVTEDGTLDLEKILPLLPGVKPGDITDAVLDRCSRPSVIIDGKPYVEEPDEISNEESD